MVAEEAWQKLQEADSLSRQAEVEISNLKARLTSEQTASRALQCAMAIIAGCYYPLADRFSQLVEQRRIISSQLER